MKSLLKYHSILYVEDSEKIRKEIAQYLEAYFGTVYTALDGREGLEMYMEYFPDVLLLDIDLPKIDGLSLARQIRKIHKNTVIVMLTAFTDKEKLLEASDLKLTKYLVKPIDLYLFNETLDLIAEDLSNVTPHYYALGSGYFWNAEKNELRFEDVRVTLSAKEEKLLALLVKERHHSVSFEEIMALVWEDEFDREVSKSCVKTLVTSLRKKLPEKSIQNVYGVGYKLS